MADFSGSWVAACGHSVQPGSRFCSVCGQPVGGGGQPNGGGHYGGGQSYGDAQSNGGQLVPGGPVPPTPYQGTPRPALPPTPQPPAEQDSLIPWSVPEGPPVPFPAPEGPPVPASYQGGRHQGGPQVYQGEPPTYPGGPQAYPGEPQAYQGEPRAWPQGPGPQGPGPQGPGDSNATLRFGFDSALPPFDPGPQQDDPGRPPFGPGGPFAAGGLRSRLRRLPRPRGPVVPAIGVAALIVVVAAIIMATRGSGGGPAPAPAAGSTATSSPAPQGASERQAATQLAMLLPQSGGDRGDVNHAFFAAQACQTLPADQQVFQRAAAGRQKLLRQLAGLSGASALDPSMIQALSGAWTASAQADTDYANWAASLEQHCHRGKTVSNPNLRASYAPGATASADKQTFIQLWNPLAAKYGLPSYRPGDL